MRVVVSAAALALAGALLLRAPGPGVSAPPARPEPRPPRAPAAPSSAPSVAAPVRDVFTYSDDDGEAEPSATAAEGPAVLAPPPPLDPAPTPPAAFEGPRLVGIVRQAGAVMAVLSIEGEVVVARVGERAGPYVVASLDEDEGVRLVDEAGSAILLPPR
jgi:hypothetical protein